MNTLWLALAAVLSAQLEVRPRQVLRPSTVLPGIAVASHGHATALGSVDGVFLYTRQDGAFRLRVGTPCHPWAPSTAFVEWATSGCPRAASNPFTLKRGGPLR
ncbi:MAG: hypothetical protein AAGJ19_03095 [Myxococcota bacterium]